MGDPCEEDARAVPLEMRVELTAAGTKLSAEVADTAETRTRGWAFRRCDLDGLLIVPDAIGPSPVALCDVQGLVDLAFVLDGKVVEVRKEVPPCELPTSQCAACMTYGDGVEVDAVLELLSGTIDLEVGNDVGGYQSVAPAELALGAPSLPIAR